MKAAGSRRKGSAGEREVVRIFQEAGIPARRVPLSGAMSGTGFGGDVYVCMNPEHWVAKDEVLIWTEGNPHEGALRGCEERLEVKRRSQGFRRIDVWLEDDFGVTYRRDRGEYAITLRLADFLEAIKR